MEKLYLLFAYLLFYFKYQYNGYCQLIIDNKRLKNHLTPLVLLSARVFSWCISDVPRDYSNLKMQKPSNLWGCTCLSPWTNPVWSQWKSLIEKNYYDLYGLTMYFLLIFTNTNCSFLGTESKFDWKLNVLGYCKEFEPR